MVPREGQASVFCNIGLFQRNHFALTSVESAQEEPLINLTLANKYNTKKKSNICS